jgi:hypothetical protein
MMQSCYNRIPSSFIQKCILLCAIITLESKFPKITAFGVAIPKKFLAVSRTSATSSSRRNHHDGTLLPFSKRFTSKSGRMTFTASYASKTNSDNASGEIKYNIHLNSNGDIEPNNRFLPLLVTMSLRIERMMMGTSPLTAASTVIDALEAYQSINQCSLQRGSCGTRWTKERIVFLIGVEVGSVSWSFALGVL